MNDNQADRVSQEMLGFRHWFLPFVSVSINRNTLETRRQGWYLVDETRGFQLHFRCFLGNVIVHKVIPAQRRCDQFGLELKSLWVAFCAENVLPSLLFAKYWL